ncbi:MAG: acyl-CoA dehydrogenase family protein, partial [Hyphomicrobiales bacterium]|nr:acyl-CoA dehydrogenase family protein [Hyphomicrobiales bacterium]
MQFTPEHDQLRRSLQKFIAAEINPHVDQWEKDGIFPAHDLFKKMGSQGFLGLTKPETWGGAGLDYSYSVVMAEELGHINCGGVPMAIGVQTDMATPALARFGSDEVCREFLVPSISGDYVACLGVSEVGAGSDVASVKTNARKDGGDYVINGGKMWTTNGTQADWMCLLANTADGEPHRNKSLICVPMKTKGVSIARKLDKLGMHSSDTAQIHFDD